MKRTCLVAANLLSFSITLNCAVALPQVGHAGSSYTIFELGLSIGTPENMSSVAVAKTENTFNEMGQPGEPLPMVIQSSGGCTHPFSMSETYTSGDIVFLNGAMYRANWFSVGEDPETHNGGPGTGQSWIEIGPCTACSTLASAPANLAASGTTSSSASLSWTAVTPPTSCTVTGYTVLKNGSAIGTTTTPSFLASGLTPDTMVNFSVETNDDAGSSAPGPSLPVRTLPCTGSCGATSVIFAPYKDVTQGADFSSGIQRSAVTGTAQPVTSVMPNKTLIWAFASGTCDNETWAGLTAAQEATNVQAFVNAGKNYIISTGGANGSFDCSSGQGLINFINRYNSPNLVGVDFDIELGQSQQLIDNLINATKAAQQQFPNLQFIFTVPSLGTTSANPITGSGVGTMVVNEIKQLGLGGNFVINLLTSDYGSTNPNNCVVVNNLCDMGQSSVAAVQALNQQSGIPFNHIGVTMMIGQADMQDEVTSLHDIDTIDAFVLSNHMPFVSFWSFDRDTPGGGGSSSSGTNVSALAYTREFMNTLGVQ